ncbi:D-aminoacyl-tRNA deacylase [Marivirga tractuosa]|uniref:D-aminoacyl-tRNA deacylase n=1 Tax=Marivirga tractuosa (strain ATCC 23168 / DSM 4126 / NBRC 15989 / NCIMB 1408 / VKM B-1430 / H-43) TaxID=643867 RepID=E4TU70_MARTH|nr:D-aminoacyl-tRNA deacylase [Marivirga tractuosa]ADR20998.1 D-tyrosyl-tRNA(Tyr) deacylase [Marivirga tractuosa DSM 4126]BDD14548.1 D-aminoacyl-tRNA deacylase [Marivirga tractuosa]
MIAVIQRVTEASVTVENKVKGEIHNGLMILLGIEEVDNEEDIEWLNRKIINMRIFNDENGVMNKSLLDIEGEILLISQFTLHASTKKGNRPSYIKAAKPDIAIPLYEKMLRSLDMAIPTQIQSGEFGGDMKVSLVNDGPVTIILDSKDKK